MSKNPFINALCATLYIVLLVSAMFYSPFFGGEQESIIFPIAGLSLFVFSAALMGYIFLYQPLCLFLDGQKKEAVNLFLKTTAFFAGTTLVLVSAWFFLSSVYT